MNVFIADISGDIAELRPDESWHCAKVLRYKPGQDIRLIDGQGHFYQAQLDLVTEKKCTARITGPAETQAKPAYHLHLAIAPTKNIDRIEWMLEKAVEIGVHEISFFVSANSERTVIKEDRLRTIIESAVKQSLQARIPVLHGLRPFAKLMAATGGQKLIAHCYDQEKLPVRQVQFKNEETLVLIGPEGDFTTQEVETALAAGFRGLSLGGHRLRTETAGLYICQAASLLSE